MLIMDITQDLQVDAIRTTDKTCSGDADAPSPNGNDNTCEFSESENIHGDSKPVKISENDQHLHTHVVHSNPMSDDDNDCISTARDIFQLSNMKQRLAIHADEMFLKVRKEHQQEINSLLKHLEKEKAKRIEATSITENLLSENRNLRENHQLNLLQLTQSYEEKIQIEVEERIARQMAHVTQTFRQLQWLLNRQRRQNIHQLQEIRDFQVSREADIQAAVDNTKIQLDCRQDKLINDIKAVHAMEIYAKEKLIKDLKQKHQDDMESLRFSSEVIAQQWTAQAGEAIQEQTTRVEKVHDLVNESVEHLHRTELKGLQQRDDTIKELVAQVKTESSRLCIFKYLILGLLIAMAVGTYIHNSVQIVQCDKRMEDLYECRGMAAIHNQTISTMGHKFHSTVEDYKRKMSTMQQSQEVALIEADRDCKERIQEIAPHEKQLLQATQGCKKTLSNLSKKCSLWSSHADEELRGFNTPSTVLDPVNIHLHPDWCAEGKPFVRICKRDTSHWPIEKFKTRRSRMLGSIYPVHLRGVSEQQTTV
eukprot:CFRG2183T1